MKKKLCIILIALSMLASFSYHPSADELSYVVSEKPITVTYNSDAILFPDAKPIIQNERTLVPLRAILERANLVVDFDTKTRTVIAVRDDLTIQMPIDKEEASIQDGSKTEIVLLDAPARIIEDRTYVPIRFIAQALSAKVNWNTNYREVVILDTKEWEKEITEKSAFLAHLMTLPAENVFQFNVDDETYHFLLSGKNVRLPFSLSASSFHTSQSFGDALKALISTDDMLYTNSAFVLDAYFSLYGIFYADEFFTTEKQRNGTVVWHYNPDKKLLADDVKTFFTAADSGFDEAVLNQTLTELSQKLEDIKRISFTLTDTTIQIPEHAYVIDELLSFTLENYIGYLFR